MIANADAGTSDQEQLDRCLEVLRERTSVEVARTSNPSELDSVLQRVGSRRLVVAGGDGSMHAVIDALHRRNQLSEVVIGLIPLGTGNDFARANKIPLDAAEAAKVIVHGRTREVDLMVDELGGVVVNNVHVGAGAQASRRGARWKKRLGSIGVGPVNLGKIGYPIGVLQSALIPPSIRLRITVDGEVVTDVDDPILMVAIGNGTSVGGGAELTPDADPESGSLEVMISRSIGPLAKVGYLVSLLNSDHTEREDVRTLRGREVSISGSGFYASADGEISGPERSRTWRLVPGAYRMTLPRPEQRVEPE